jgi:hypothetical protein
VQAGKRVGETDARRATWEDGFPRCREDLDYHLCPTTQSKRATSCAWPPVWSRCTPCFSVPRFLSAPTRARTWDLRIKRAPYQAFTGLTGFDGYTAHLAGAVHKRLRL